MVRHLLRASGTALVIASGLVVPVLTTAPSTPAAADTVIGGCTIVSNPTPTHFTDCPGQLLEGANLKGVNLSNANLSNTTLAACFSGGPPFCVEADFTNANLRNANLTGVLVGDAAGGRCGVFPCGASGSAIFTGANLSGANLSHTEYGGTNFVGANFTGANLSGTDFDNVSTSLGAQTVGATLTGANFTDTIYVPPNQTATATSQTGAAVTWTTPAGFPGAMPGSCTPPSGSTFPLFTSTVTCQVLDANSDVATGTFQVTVQPTTQYFTRVILPSDNAMLAGRPVLDALASDPPGVSGVVFELSGGSLNQQVIATATPTIYGWLAQWNSATVPNGTYSLQSEATDASHTTDTSEPVSVTVNNQPPATAVLIPSGETTLSGAGAVLDASASSAFGIAQLTFEVSGGALSNQVIATATPTIYGWLAKWNTTTVPNGTYALESVAADTDSETATSAPVTITVDNAAPTTAVLVPSNGATVSGAGSVLDAGSSANVTTVIYVLTGNGLTNQLVATGVPTYYGWLAKWDTTTVPNGTYALQSVAAYADGVNGTSPPLSITVSN